MYNLILEDALTELIVKDDSEFEQDIPNLVVTRLRTYLFCFFFLLISNPFFFIESML